VFSLNSCGIEGFLIIFCHLIACFILSFVIYKKVKSIQDKK